MNKDELSAAVKRYSERLAQFGPDERAVGWGEKGRSKLRFEILLSQWDFAGASVLDAGCGLGSLWEYIQQKGIRNLSYLGIDINPEFIALAAKRYPGAAFKVQDFHAGDLERVDYVLSSGPFNHQLKDNWGFVRDSFARFHESAKKGFAVNFLSTHVDYPLEDAFHADPARVLDLAYRYSNNVVLRNDYMPYEYTIFVNTSAAVDQPLTVYENYVRFV